MDFHIEVVTYEKIVLSRDINFALVRTREGDMGILANHAPFIAELSIGEMKIRDDKGEEKYFISGGLIEISDNNVRIIATEAIEASKLDIERERRQVENLRAKLAKLKEDKDILLTQKNLRDALMRVNVVEKMM